MNSTPRTYASEEAKEAFLGLPESDQAVLKTVHHAEAEALNAVMNTKVNVIMEDAGIKAPESAIGVIDRGTYLEVDGWKVSKENLGAPTLREGEIEINAEKASRTVPQAWSKEVDGQTLWFYNYEGAKKEIEHRGEYAPSQEELLQMVNSVSGNAREKAQALNIPLAGYRFADNGKFGSNEGVIAYLWSSSPNGDDRAQFVYLHQVGDGANGNCIDRGLGFLVRPFLDNKRVSENPSDK